MIHIQIDEDQFKRLMHGETILVDGRDASAKIRIGEVTWGAMMKHMLDAADDQEEMAMKALGQQFISRQRLEQAEEQARQNGTEEPTDE